MENIKKMDRREEFDTLRQLNMVKNFFELSNNEKSCTSLRSTGCIPILVEILYATDTGNNGDDVSSGMRKYASQALYNIVNSNPVEKDRRLAVKILNYLDEILKYSNFLKTLVRSGGEAIADVEDRHPLTALLYLKKSSFDEEHRNIMCELGVLKALPNLIYLDHAAHGPHIADTKCCNALRQNALLILTNLIYGDENNKAYLCGQKPFMDVMIALLDTAPDELLTAVVSILRNLSWRTDKNLKITFNEISTVTALTQAAMKHNKNENILMSILSVVWNLSANCNTNKADFCGVNGVLAFYIRMLKYKGPSKTLKIVENAGGILRNVSSYIAECEQYRQIVRSENGLGILLKHLNSDNLTVVSNACGTLWNLSACCPIDQKFLLDHGAIPLLRGLITSKNTMIVKGSAGTLKNLIAFDNSLNHQKMRKIFNIIPMNNIKNKNINSETLKRKNIADLENSPSYHQREQHKFTDIGSTASLPPSMQKKSNISPNSVYSIKSDSAVIPKTQSQMWYYNDLTSRPLAIKVGSCVQDKRYAAEINDDERPIDDSMTYVEHQNWPQIHNSIKPKKVRSSFHETDLDQPIDFSMRYMEGESNRKMSYIKKSSEELLLNKGISSYEQIVKSSAPALVMPKAASTNDLLDLSKSNYPTNGLATRTIAVENLASLENYQRTDASHTPERPILYCEEGTPGYFSRYDSINSLVNITCNETKNRSTPEETKESTTPPLHDFPANSRPPPKKYPIDDQKQAVMLSSAMETPLMFSRRSSMDSLVNEGAGGPCDDNASMISEYSRMQSGVNSPIPDSPTQNMARYTRPQQVKMDEAFMNKRRPIWKVFEDDFDIFEEENTPASFSRFSSVSNMSIADEDNNVLLPLELGEDKKSHQEMDVDDNIVNNRHNDKTSNDTIIEHCPQTQYKKVCVGVNHLKLDDSIDVDIDIDVEGDVEVEDVEMDKDTSNTHQMPSEDAISKMRRGGSALPSYIPVTDEMNKYGVENSPCNFSFISGLSHLTIESNFNGPARDAKDSEMQVEVTLPTAPSLPLRSNTSTNKGLHVQHVAPQLQQQVKKRRGDHPDSLSSLSMDSDDDTQLLNQAIAAGSQRKILCNNATVIASWSPPKCYKLDTSTTETADTEEDCHLKSLFQQTIKTGMHKSSDGLIESTNKSSPRKRSSVIGNLYTSNPSFNRNDKHYATLSPPRRRHTRIVQHDKRRLSANSPILPKKVPKSSAASKRVPDQINCVSNQVHHFEEMSAIRNAARANVPMISNTFGRRNTRVKSGSVHQQWV